MAGLLVKSLHYYNKKGKQTYEIGRASKILALEFHFIPLI